MGLDPASMAFVTLQGERGELVRLGEDIVSAPTPEDLKYAISQMRAYLAVLKERDRPMMEAIEKALRTPAPAETP